jgi:signal transduction histidine kinase
MKSRTASRCATGLWLLALVLVMAGVGLRIASNTPFLELGVILFTTIGYATVGRLIASRQPSNPIGWLFLSSGVAFAIAGITDAYAIRGLETAPGSLPLVPLAVWIQNWIFVPAMASIPLAVLLFPTGGLLSPRWRPVAWLLIVGAALAVLGLILKPGPAGGTVTIPNPTGVRGLAPVAGGAQLLAGMMVVSGAVASVVALVVRFGRARGQERQQLRWLVYASGSAMGIFALSWLAEPLLGERGVPVGNVLFVGFFVVLTLGIPIATGIAILRYRLYALDIVIKKTVVFGLLAAFVTAAYFVVVVGIPSLVFGADVGRVGLLPFAAAAVLAIAFQPLRRAANRMANRLVYGDRATPYEVLSEFAGRAAGTVSTEEVLPRMAELIRRGTGASRAAVWLQVGGDLRREAVEPRGEDTWPVSIPGEGGELPRIPEADAVVPVRHRGETLGALTVRMPASEPLTPAHEALLNDVASQAGLVLRNVRLIEELRASRQRLVAAQDEERRRLERNIHDGAQQQLVALAVKMRLVSTMAEKDPPKAAQLADQAKGELQDALNDLRDLARGIYPPLLADQGLAAALDAQARKAAVPVEVHPDGVGRYPQEVEAGAYFCVLEAMQNVAKYAEASRVNVSLRQENGHLVFEVRDDGKGFDPERTPKGSGLTNMRDRLEALGGSVEVSSHPGSGTSVRGRIPVGSDK